MYHSMVWNAIFELSNELAPIAEIKDALSMFLAEVPSSIILHIAFSIVAFAKAMPLAVLPVPIIEDVSIGVGNGLACQVSVDELTQDEIRFGSIEFTKFEVDQTMLPLSFQAERIIRIS